MNLIISPTDFLYKGTVYFLDSLSGRYYRLAEPSGFYTKTAREGGLVKKRISQAQYNECQAACRQILSGGAA
jgi:hypothetical protein